MNMTATETHTARKTHRCQWCWQCIEVGTKYRRYRFYDGGDVGTVKMHPECHDAMQVAAAEEGGCVEWTPGQERPQPNAKSEPTSAALSREVGSTDGL